MTGPPSDETAPDAGGDSDADADGRGGATADHPTSRSDAASPEKVEELVREFEVAGRPFARVTVVRREAPVSANVGDRAVVTADGDLVGWIGGAACAQSVVVKEATAALGDGEPRLVALAPDPETVDRPGVRAYPMTCHSGGTLELFVEPVTPRPRLVVAGTSPVALSLARLAGALTYDVTVLTDGEAGTPEGVEAVAVGDETALAESLSGARYVVVASMSDFDERVVAAALRADPDYVGLVSSADRRDQVAATVAERVGRDVTAVAGAVKSPAGVDVGAQTAEEIAVAILAELVAVRRQDSGDAGDSPAWDAAGDEPAPIEIHGADDRPVDERGVSEHESHDHAESEHESHDHSSLEASADSGDRETVVDPVCGMDVVVGEAAATVDYEGETYHFCGQGCADAFRVDPERYLSGVTPDE